jgi:hypothetical protein
MTTQDKNECVELIQAWGRYRDRNLWPQLLATFAPDGVISVSWFSGPFSAFVEVCRNSAAVGGSWARHELFAPHVRINGARAIAETSVVIRVRQKFGTVAADLTSCGRFADRLVRSRDGWRIAERAAIYERDRLDPVEPSADFDALFRAADTSIYPEQYRYMAFRLANAPGRSLAPVVYRDGGEETEALSARFEAWLAGA